ncbi:hypothetical protein GCM10010096_11750 [Alcaligenes pakistanensis]|uniref:Uncharacterized protein n=1 Tax=Alcaligenes pakistanensis TaxID=1482717 RepID=A0A8H9INJ0_9BURK|nr:hypothetical protein GCM10010096_11750 [Alcaligenes pakistanensis]
MARVSAFALPMSLPAMYTWPLLGLSSNPIIFNKVLFPEPEVPTIAQLVPTSIDKETLFNTGFEMVSVLYIWVMFCMLTKSTQFFLSIMVFMVSVPVDIHFLYLL